MNKYDKNIVKCNLEKYNTTPLFYEKFQVLLLMENANVHLVSLFKDYLLYDDSTEFFKEYYRKKEIYPLLKKIYNYYECSSYLFPNYTAINEGKYIYRNIIRKQKLIDYLEDLEEKKCEKEEKRKKKYRNQSMNENSSSFIEVFSPKIYENIRKETENDSKINELFCIGNGNKTNSGCDSILSILKLTEEIKENDKDKRKELEKSIKYKTYKNSNNKNIISNNDISIKKNHINNKKINNENFSNGIIDSNNNIIDNNKPINFNNKIVDNKKDSIKKINQNSSNDIDNNKSIKQHSINDIGYKKSNIRKKLNKNNNKDNHSEGKLYISRRINVSQNISRNSKKIYNKKLINKNIKINSNILSDNQNSSLRNYNHLNLTERNKDSNKLNLDQIKSNNFMRSRQNLQSNKNFKNNYKKNNIIINIINNNKNNNYHYINNYYTNNTNTNNNKNKSNNNNQEKYIKTEKINYKASSNTRISTENNNNNRSNIIIGFRLNSKGKMVKNKSISKNSKKNSNTNKNLKKNKKYIKSNLLSSRLTDSNFLRNLTERIKNQSNSNSIKKYTNKIKTKAIISPKNRLNMKKRNNTEMIMNKTDILLFGQQFDSNQYKKSINRQILKNINLTNNKKGHKEISIVNKKIINYRLNLNNILNNHKNINKSNNKSYIKHVSKNSQNLTDIKIISKIGSIPINQLIKKNGIGSLNLNKTERTSRNHSKNDINKIYNTTIKKNYLDSLSSKNNGELIYNKIHKIQNKKNIYSFLKCIKSDKKIKNLKAKKNKNYTTVCNINDQGITNIMNSKEIHKRTSSEKNY